MSTFFIIPVFYFDLSTSHKSFLFTFMGQIQTKPFLFHVYGTNINKKQTGLVYIKLAMISSLSALERFYTGKLNVRCLSRQTNKHPNIITDKQRKSLYKKLYI